MSDYSVSFRSVLRGYDPTQVDHHMNELAQAAAKAWQEAAERTRQISELEAANGQLKSEVEGHAQRARVLEKAQMETTAPTYTGLGERIGSVLTLVDTEVYELRTRAQADSANKPCARRRERSHDPSGRGQGCKGHTQRSRRRGSPDPGRRQTAGGQPSGRRHAAGRQPPRRRQTGGRKPPRRRRPPDNGPTGRRPPGNDPTGRGRSPLRAGTCQVRGRGSRLRDDSGRASGSVGLGVRCAGLGSRTAARCCSAAET